MKKLLTLLLTGMMALSIFSAPALASDQGPKMTQVVPGKYTAFENHGRVYIIGKDATVATFKKSGHLPYTRTLLGAGPKGQTVVFEVDKKNPKLADQLVAAYKKTPYRMMDNGKDMFVYRAHGRTYVIGTPKTNAKFMKSGHLPYTKTIIGGGPFGDTLVYEVAKKKPEFVKDLMKRFDSTPFELESNGKDYFVYKLKGRVYVIGQAKTNVKFKKSGHLPYTRTLLGAGPNGETVVFEVNKKDKSLADRLQKSYL